jgi:hypothetical protein
MFHTEKHELTNDQIIKLNNYMDLIILPNETYETHKLSDQDVKYSTITDLCFMELFTPSSTMGNRKQIIKNAYMSLQTKLNEYANSNNIGSIIDNVLLKNGFILHNLQNCFMQNIFSLLLFLRNNHNKLYKNTSIKKINNELYNKINQLKQKITKLNNCNDNNSLFYHLNFDKDNGITTNDFYPITKCDILRKELNIKPLNEDDDPEKCLHQISNNSCYYVDKIIKLITNLNYTNFMIYTYKFNIIICKLYFLNYIIHKIPTADYLNSVFYNDGSDESLINFAKNYCSWTKRKLINDFENGKINKDEFLSKLNINISSKYYFTNSELRQNGFHRIELARINKSFDFPLYGAKIHYKMMDNREIIDRESIELKNIFITIVRDIFNLPFENYNKTLIEDINEIELLTNGIYINSQIAGHYNNFIKHNNYYIMFDDIIYKPTKTFNNNKDILYKNIEIKKLDGKLYTNSIVSNNKISTPFIIESENLSKDLIILLGRKIFIGHDEGYKNGFNSFSFDTTNISKMH